MFLVAAFVTVLSWVVRPAGIPGPALTVVGVEGKRRWRKVLPMLVLVVVIVVLTAVSSTIMGVFGRKLLDISAWMQVRHQAGRDNAVPSEPDRYPHHRHQKAAWVKLMAMILIVLKILPSWMRRWVTRRLCVCVYVSLRRRGRCWPCCSGSSSGSW
jgi:hypothetical protein